MDVPLTVGGGATDVDLAYKQIKDAVGVGGSAPDESGIDGLWRSSKAAGLAAASSSEQRAVIQGFPRYATDLLAYYERRLGIAPPPGSNETQRGKVVTEQWYQEPAAATPDLAAELAKIDPRVTIREENPDHAIQMHYGRAFQSHDSLLEGPAFNLQGGRGFSLLPNFSTHQHVRVRFTLGYDGVPSETDKRILLRVRKFLLKSVPSDTNFSISTGPWKLGKTPIGLGALA